MRSKGFGLYVHWPFCRSKCPYCDFNSHAARSIDQARWRAALLREMEYFAQLSGPRVIQSIYFGGGTPSLMDPATCGALLEQAARLWQISEDVEITLEANPSTAERQRFADFRAAGINRLSLGVQSLDPSSLAFLGRGHDVPEALAAVDLARSLFPRFSFDLIYARPKQSLAQWEQELALALSMAGDHLSLYQLTIEDGTAFAPRHERGEFSLPEDVLAADFYALTEQMTHAAGLPAYEVSNYARPGGESRHNLLYWQGGDYAGMGPGAHGRLNRLATRQEADPAQWLELVERIGHGTIDQEWLTAEERAVEQVMMGLRLVNGIEADKCACDASLNIGAVMDWQQIQALQEEGLLSCSNRQIKTTFNGRLMLNSVLHKIVK